MTSCITDDPNLQCEREARYHQYVSRQPFHHIDTLDDARKRRILKRSGVSPTLSPSSAVAERANGESGPDLQQQRYGCVLS